MNKLKYLLISLLIMVSIGLAGQNLRLTIGNESGCNDSQVLVPVVLENASSIGAISLEISYDNTSLEFVALENLHPDFDGFKFNDITDPTPTLLISWIDHQGADIDSAAIFKLKFNFTANAGSLTFNSNCEIATTTLQIPPAEYINGSVNPSISISSQPADSTITPPDGAGFQVAADGGTQFQWQQSFDGLNFTNLTEDAIYQGVNAPNLYIVETDMSMDSTFYRCIISNVDCELHSAVASLNFEGTKYQQIILKEGWTSLSSYVVPLDENVESVLESISNSLEYLFNNEGYFNPQTGTNTLVQFDPQAGYAIKLSQTDTLFMAGLKMDSTQLTVPEGWSYLPVLSDCNITVSDLFGAAISDVIIIKEIAGNNVYWPEKGINTLTILETGKSYLLKTVTDFDLNFPECDQ